MTERAEMMTREQILTNFPPQEEVFDAGKRGKVIASVSRNSEGVIVFMVPGSTKWLEKGEQQENQAMV